MRLAAILSARTDCDVRAVIVPSAPLRLPVLERAPARCCPYHIASHPPEPVSVGNVALAPFAGAAESAAAWPAPQLLGVQSDAQVNGRGTKGDNQSPVNRRRPGGLGVLRQERSARLQGPAERAAGLAAAVVPMCCRAPGVCPGDVGAIIQQKGHQGQGSVCSCNLPWAPLAFTMGARHLPLARDGPCVPPVRERPPLLPPDHQAML